MEKRTAVRQVNVVVLLKYSAKKIEGSTEICKVLKL